MSQIETEGQFPHADYAFDQGVLSRPLTELIEAKGKHWVTEVERSRNIMWNGQWQRVDRVAEELKAEHPESFRHKSVRCRNNELREIWAFTKVVRLKKYGRATPRYPKGYAERYALAYANVTKIREKA